jgi:hypothetical protein
VAADLETAIEDYLDAPPADPLSKSA